MSDLEMRDTPALAVLRQQPAALGHIDPVHIAAAQTLLRVSKKLLGVFGEEFALRGLSPGRYAVLMALHARDGSLAPSELADRVGVTRATMTDLITGLVGDGLVASAPADERDRRRKAVALTGKGAICSALASPRYLPRWPNSSRRFRSRRSLRWCNC